MIKVEKQTVLCFYEVCIVKQLSVVKNLDFQPLNLGSKVLNTYFSLGKQVVSLALRLSVAQSQVYVSYLVNEVMEINFYWTLSILIATCYFRKNRMLVPKQSCHFLWFFYFLNRLTCTSYLLSSIITLRITFIIFQKFIKVVDFFIHWNELFLPMV